MRFSVPGYMVTLEKNYHIKKNKFLNSNNDKDYKQYLSFMPLLTRGIGFILILGLVATLLYCFNIDINNLFAKSPIEIEAELAAKRGAEVNAAWHPAEISKDKIKDSNQYNQIIYGRELIKHTAKYLGPRGSVAPLTNGMNCQNCHLEAGTLPWGNNYGSVFATYPKYRARSGTKENIYKRINDCMERSLNGKALDENSDEMQAMKSYIEYIGSNVAKNEKAKASGIYEIDFLKRAADPLKGKELYTEKCQSCHQAIGEGVMAADNIEYKYPPLWGKNSYNHGAGLFRLSRLAGYIRYNMPQGATYVNPKLTDEEAWDIAAYINTQERPEKDLSNDWPKIAEKPIDHPFGPFADAFDEKQHKLGPFQPIKDFKKKNEIKNN